MRPNPKATMYFGAFKEAIEVPGVPATELVDCCEEQCMSSLGDLPGIKENPFGAGQSAAAAAGGHAWLDVFATRLCIGVT